MPEIPPLVLPIAVVIVVLALVLVALSAGRRRRDAALEPTRLGPSWAPPSPDPGQATAVDPPDVDPERVGAVAQRSGWDEPVVATVLGAWIEYLGVVGLRNLPADHDYRVYDPYDPPVVTRTADRTPIVDPERVARDVATRLRLPEVAATEILAADRSLAAETGDPDHLADDGVTTRDANLDDLENLEDLDDEGPALDPDELDD